MGGQAVVKQMLSYIEKNLEKDLTWEKVAEDLHYSKFYLARVFKENTGVTLCKYVQGRRLEVAAKKLVETKQPVVAIALEAGYHSQQAFARAFHYKYECTPQEYRRLGIFISKQGQIVMEMTGQTATLFLSCRKGRAAA